MNPLARQKKQLIAILLMIIAGMSGKLFAQEKYNDDVLEKIKLVENNLGTWLKLADTKPMNLEARMKELNIPAVTVAVISNYKLEWAKAYGYADKATGKLATTKTLFQAASISKSLNSVGALVLMQNKKIDLKNDINNYLLSWKFPYDSLSANKIITVANLLSHTGGLTIHGFPGYEVTDTIPTVNQVLDGKPPANTEAVRSAFAPGTKVVYSGGGTTISQVIISDQSKMVYAQFMYEKVLKPLGMTTSFYGRPESLSQKSVISTGHKNDGTEIKGKYHVYPEQAAAALWTNPSDLARYIIESQLAWNGKSSKVLTQETTKLRLTPVLENAALGVFIMKKGGATYFQHGGANEGFRSQYFGDLENGNGVVVMVNSDNGQIMNEIINSVATVYKWKEFYTPVVKSIAKVPDETLAKYPGTYVVGTDTLTITKAGNQLTLKDPGGTLLEMLPESDILFFFRDFPVQVEFAEDKLFILNNGQRSEAKKL